MLTCDCGARFEVDDTLAGQEVACPECQQPVKVPARHKAVPRTSGYALASVVVALVGAFTPATLVAVGLGVAGLASIRRNRERVTGAGFAILGIALGLVFSTLTALAVVLGFTGLGGYVRQRSLEKHIDTTGPLEVVVAGSGFAITRPSEKWGKLPAGRGEDPIVDRWQGGCDLVLAQPAHYTFVDVHDEPAAGAVSLERVAGDLVSAFEPPRPGKRNRQPADDDEDFPLPAKAQLIRLTRLDEAGREGREMLVDVRVLGQQWRFLIRLYRQANGPVYVVRAYARARLFTAVEAELRQALDSFRILRGG